MFVLSQTDSRYTDNLRRSSVGKSPDSGRSGRKTGQRGRYNCYMGAYKGNAVAYALVQCQRPDMQFTTVTDPLLRQWALETLQQLPPSNKDMRLREVMDAELGFELPMDRPELPCV